MVPGQERGPLLGQSISTGQARVKQHPASEGVLVRYRGGGRVAIVDRPAEHWLKEELREDVERPDDARIPIARLAGGIDHGPELWPGYQELILLGQIVQQPRQQEFDIGVNATRLGGSDAVREDAQPGLERVGLAGWSRQRQKSGLSIGGESREVNRVPGTQSQYQAPGHPR